MNYQIIINNITVDLTATGMDNVPEHPCSDRIQEEKLSLLLWNEFLAGRLEMTVHGAGAGENAKFPCRLTDKDGRIFCNFTLTKDILSLILLHRNPYELPTHGWSMHLSPELHNRSLYGILQDATDYKGIASMSNHFGEEPHGFSAFKLSEYRFRLEKFTTSCAKQYRTDISEEFALQWEVNQQFDTMFPNGLFEPVPSFPTDTINNWMVMCFDFTNEIGEVMQKVLKAYRIHKAHNFVKCYFPLTRWYCKDIHVAFTAKVGMPEKQILFNLHLVIKAEVVVVCTSLESALANQQINLDNETVAFTAFVCDGARFDQVDFTPLKGKIVRVLVANHSAFTLAQSYIADNVLYEYLRDEIKIEDLGIIQMEVKYPDISDVYDIDQLMSVHRQEKPQIVDGSVFEVVAAELPQMCEKAQGEIERKRTQSQDFPFWNNTESVHVDVVNPVAEKLTDKMIMRPIIVGGQITMIESAPGIGKTCLTTALCAQIVGSNAPFLTERCWTRCTPLDNPKRGYKVVYLTFDSDGVASISEHRADFAHDLGEYDENFIQKDMSGDMNDYTKEGNYNQFVDLVKSFYAQGTQGQPVDVLVIDTLLAFAHKAINNAHLMLRKLCDDFPNMAIILIHHLNKANETYGGVKGTMSPRTILSLSRTEEQEPKGKRATLEDAFTIKIEKSSMNKIGEDGESFEAKLNEKNEFIVVNPKRPLNEMRKLLIQQYDKKYRLTQAEIARLFGITTDRTIRNWLSEEKES